MIDQIRTVIRTFRDNLFKPLDAGGIFPGRSEVPKTLIFAKDDSHADDIVRICREEFGRGNDFAVKITYRTTGVKPQDLLNPFRSHEITRRVLQLCIERLDAGALLMADNALRQGEVIKPKTQQARNVAIYNEMVSKHPQLESVVIPIRDGLSVARVRD